MLNPLTSPKKNPRRPREKLSQVGQSNLTILELLALIIGSGTKRFPVIKIAQQLQQQFSLSSYSTLTLPQLLKIPGIGTSQASRLLACVELGKRIFTIPTLIQITGSEQAVSQASAIRHLQKEHLLGLYLNARQELVHQEVITIGGLNYTNVSPRDVYAPALPIPAAYIILIHNHPSGSAEPSQADLEVTERLEAAGQLLGIALLDHIIVTSTTYYSFKESNLF